MTWNIQSECSITQLLNVFMALAAGVAHLSLTGCRHGCYVWSEATRGRPLHLLVPVQLQLLHLRLEMQAVPESVRRLRQDNRKKIDQVFHAERQ